MSEPLPQENLGPYKLLECRAKGPIASLYTAEDRARGGKVLIRIVEPLASRNPQIRAALEELRNPQSHRRIHDPSILRILDVGVRDESYFVVYEYADAMPLNQFLRETRPPLKEALVLARMLAEALRAIHGYGIVHGDIKPQNVLIGRDSRSQPLVKIALADLAHTASESMISVLGEIVGTPRYLSPEQIEGKRATPASDIFSLGVLFYELFTGAEPFPADNALGYLHANAQAKVRPLYEVDTSIPVDLSRVVERMLARDPHGRYRSAQAVLDDLERVEAQLGGTAPLPTRPVADSAFASAPAAYGGSVAAWRTVAVVSLAAAVLLLVAVVVMTLSQVRTRRDVGPVDYGPPGAGAVGDQARRPAAPDASAPVASGMDEAALDAVRQQVRRQARAGRYDEALDTLRTLLARCKGAPLADRIRLEIACVQFEKAQAHMTAGEQPEALAMFRSIRDEYPDTQWAAMSVERAAETMLNQARSHESRGELKEAIASLEALLKEFGESAAAADARRRRPILRARLAQALAPVDPDRAVAVAEGTPTSGLSPAEAKAVQSSQGRALLARADSHLRGGRFEECLTDLRAALTADRSLTAEIKPKIPEALSRLALELKAKGRLADAVARWRELQRQFPLSIWVARGKAEMAPLLQAADKLGPGPVDDAAILLELADAEIAANNLDAARPHLERLLKDYPRSSSAAAGRQILAQRDLDEALEMGRSGQVERARDQLAAIARSYAGTQAAADAAQELARWTTAPDGMAYVPAGTFVMGLQSDRAEGLAARHRVPELMARRWLGPQRPDRNLTAKACYIDRAEVTNAQYKSFVDATGHPAPPSPAWEGNQVKPDVAHHPVTHVTWDDADAYAKWAGKRLPTEAEWERAARGGDGRLFPWGETYDPKLCVTALDGAKGTSDVGTRPQGRSPFGCDDMIGNVLEWTRDSFLPYPGAEAEGLPFDETKKVARGAGWDEEDPLFTLCTTRHVLAPDTRAANLGFRCVKDVESRKKDE